MAVLVCLVSFATSSNSIVYAADKSYDEISKEYNLKTATEIPQNVTPIRINSEKELLTVLQNIDNDLAKFKNKPKKTIVIAPENSADGITAASTTRTYEADYYVVGGTAKIRLMARVTSEYEQITNVDEYTTFTGFTYGFDWVESAIGHDISSDKKDVEVWCSGQVDCYLLINGLIKYYSVPVDLNGYLMIFH